MKRVALSLLVVATFAGLASPAQAIDWRQLPSMMHWNLNSMTSNEQARINAGRSNGSLTAAEASRLQARLNQIKDMQRNMSRNGISYQEQQRLDAQLDQLAQEIYRESNDRQALGRKPWGWAPNYTYPTNNNGWKNGHWQNGRWIGRDMRDSDRDGKPNWRDPHYNRANVGGNPLGDRDRDGKPNFADSRDNRDRDRDGKPNWRDPRDNRVGGGSWKDGDPGRGMTANEAAKNAADRARLNNLEASMKSDGRLNGRERQVLQQKDRQLDRQERRDRRD